MARLPDCQGMRARVWQSADNLRCARTGERCEVNRRGAEQGRQERAHSAPPRREGRILLGILESFRPSGIDLQAGFSRLCVVARQWRGVGKTQELSAMIVFQGLRPGNVRSPSGRKQKLFIVHQGLRPWQRSCALRAEREGVHCPPGTASLATFVRPPGGETEVVHCPPGITSLATFVALRAKTQDVHCPPSGAEAEVVGCPPGGLRPWQHSPALRAELNDASAPRRLTNS